MIIRIRDYVTKGSVVDYLCFCLFCGWHKKKPPSYKAFKLRSMQ